MKSALIKGLYAVVLALTLHESQALIHEKLFRKQADATERDSDSIGQRFCKNYMRLGNELRSCIGVGSYTWRNSYVTLSGLTNMCRNKDSIRQCMVDKIVNCECNYNELVRLLVRGLSYCVGEEVPMDVRHYLQADNITVTESCDDVLYDLESMVGPQCELSRMPNPRMAGNMTVATAEVDNLMWWYQDCMMGTNLTEVADAACGNVTRGQAYGLAISNLPLSWAFGINHYDKFEAFQLAYDGLGYF